MLILIASLLALITFLLIPLIGTFSEYVYWSKFRRVVGSSAMMPELAISLAFQNDRELGSHSFRGRIDALGNDGVVWIRSDKISVKASMEYSEIYIMPDEGKTTESMAELLDKGLPSFKPNAISWNQMKQLQEGYSVYLVGFPSVENGLLTLKGRKDKPLIVLINEIDHVVEEAVWSGRSMAIYWNHFTHWSLVLGFLGIIVIALAVFIFEETPAVVLPFFMIAFLPLIPYLPPGLFLNLVAISSLRRIIAFTARLDLLSFLILASASNHAQVSAKWKEINTELTNNMKISFKRRILVWSSVAIVAFMTGLAINLLLYKNLTAWIH